MSRCSIFPVARQPHRATPTSPGSEHLQIWREARKQKRVPPVDSGRRRRVDTDNVTVSVADMAKGDDPRGTSGCSIVGHPRTGERGLALVAPCGELEPAHQPTVGVKRLQRVVRHRPPPVPSTVILAERAPRKPSQKEAD